MSIKKKLRIISIIFGIGLFVGYIYEYQQLINEGVYLSDEHCIKVNPLIIDRKNKYLDQYNILLAGAASSEEYITSLGKYLQSGQAFMKAEKDWLEKEKQYMGSKEFNLLMPSHIKEALKYQYEMYEAEYNSSYYISQGFEEADQEKRLELSNKIVEETARSREAGDKYNELLKKYGGKMTWVYYFVKVPSSQCPPENNNIPIVPNLFTPQIPISSEETKG
ncbi:hypothetical protein KKE03_03485 [Patescibacteria group bacterium]|nr:hypothetical protein [Patescibacteria group bacterium]